MDDFDEDTFVTIGTPLPPFEEGREKLFKHAIQPIQVKPERGEPPEKAFSFRIKESVEEAGWTATGRAYEAPKKPVALQDQTVRDEKGRQRFHGAFTGGFSAGYFNTVGTKEGWTPSTFVSSRHKKAEPSASQLRPEHFMDEEDFADHGIAPRSVKIMDDFASTEKERKRKAQSVADGGGVILGEALLEDLVVPTILPIGVRLLRNLGWKEGQGIGPRVKKTLKKKKAHQEPAQKTYGCAPLPGSADESEESEEDIYAKDILFAPKDINPITFEPKDNLHGLGYSGINPDSALGMGHINLFEPVAVGLHGKKGMRGQAFGTGALEDEDEDIYALDRMSNYDRELGGPEQSDTHGWTAPRHRASQQLPIGQLGQALEGFQLAGKPLKPKKVYPPPKLPRDFKPRRTPKEPDFHNTASEPQPTKAPDRKLLDANTRGALLGEQSVKSVFDLVSDKDKAKLQSPPSSQQQPSTAAVSTPSVPQAEPPIILGSSHIRFTIGKRSSVEDQRKQALPLYQGGAGSAFKPFASDPAKQARYEAYQRRLKHGEKEPDTLGQSSQLTEWERERELEEFGRAAQLYRPLSAMMANRFTSARFSDNADNVEVPAQEGGERNDQTKAAKMKMFGKLTRDAYEWHPDNVLCKRFNIPNPYPDSNIVGLPMVKRDKFSVFNFLDTPAQFQQQQQSPALSKESKEEDKPAVTMQSVAAKHKHGAGSGKKSTFKPLAILGEVDLSVKPPPTQTGCDAAEPDAKLQIKEETAVAEGAEEEEKIEDVVERPPMDLFRAIFQNSDTDESSSESEEEKPITEPKVETEVARSVVGVHVNGGQTVAEPGTIHVETLEERMSVSQEEGSTAEAEAAYGPVLPPLGALAAGTESSVSSLPGPGLLSHQKFKHRHKEMKDSNRRKDRHKHKKAKKKSKHKKHRSKSKSSKGKKKKKKKVVVSSSSSSSGSDADSESEDSDHAAIPTDTDLLNKLRSLPSSARPTAADFW